MLCVQGRLKLCACDLGCVCVAVCVAGWGWLAVQHSLGLSVCGCVAVCVSGCVAGCVHVAGSLFVASWGCECALCG